ncbi:CPBP family intramembrane metalloprotease [bacterium]|nr:CPBP family intramembrane metalloprotease [bacterium]
MKKILGMGVLLVILAATLKGCGPEIVQAGRLAVPAAWTEQGPGQKTISLRAYGGDQLLRKGLFESASRRRWILILVGFYALAGLLLIRAATSGSNLLPVPKWPWVDLAWVIVGVVVFQEALSGNTSGPAPMGLLCLFDVSVCLWIWALARARGVDAKSFGLSPRRIWWQIPLGVGTALLMFPAVDWVMLTALVSAGPSSIPGELTVPVPVSCAAGVLAVALLPFAEEIVFRGFLYRLLRARWPEWISNLAVSALFAAAHDMPGSVGLARFLGSLLMCRLYERTGSLWSGLAAHATFNAILLLGPHLL